MSLFSFDTYNLEFINISNPNINLGLRTEVSKSIGKNMQFTTIIHNKSRQYFSTLFGNTENSKSMFQFGWEPSGSFQMKTSVEYKNAIAKYQSIVTKSKETFSQLECIYNSKFYNIALKLVKPAFEASNLIYIMNYWRTFGKVSGGFEIVGLNNHVTMGFAGRVEHSDCIGCISLQRFNLLTISFYKKLLNNLEVGAEMKRTNDSRIVLVGSRIKNKRTELKCSVDSHGNVGFSWDEHLSENLRVGFSGEYGCDEFNYGISMSFED